MRKALTFFILITVAAMLGGCIQVASTDPANGATSVARNTTIKVTFNMDANPSTVNAGTFLVKDSLNNPVEGTVSYSKKVATFTPKSDLALLRGFTVTITTGVKDTFGIPMDTEYSFSFTTKDGGWKIAELIETDNTENANNPQIAVDPYGNAIAVWAQFDGTQFSIWANRYTPTDGWGTAQYIDNNTLYTNHLDIAIDPAGNAIAVWLKGKSICANRYTPESGWGTPEIIGTNVRSPIYPQIAVDPAGNAIAIWQLTTEDLFSPSSIWANRYTPTSGWETAQLFAENANNPQIAFDPNGNAIAVWQQANGTNFNIYANRYTPTGGWGTAQIIDNNTWDANHPDIAIDPAGNAIVVWLQFDGIWWSIWANRYTPGSGWGAAEPIETNNVGDAWFPQVAVDPAGNAIAVWPLSDGGIQSNIWANRYTPTTGWETAQRIETENVGYIQTFWWQTPQVVAVDPAGNAIALWQQREGTQTRIWANRYTPASGWETAQLLAENAYNPQIAVDPYGNAIAVWTQFDGAFYNIVANRFE